MSNPILQRLANGAGARPNRQTSNPLAEIAQARRSGISPLQFVQTRMERTPQAQEAMRILSGDQAQLKATAEQIAQQRGINLGEFVQQARSMF